MCVVCAHPPRATPGHLKTLLTPGVRLCQNLSHPGVGSWFLHTNKHVEVETVMAASATMEDIFKGKSMDFVADWLKQESLEKLVNIFEGECIYNGHT